MNTDTAEPLKKTAGFEFNDAGVCTNPEKVLVRCNAIGAACALLIARDGASWLAGYQCGGRNVAYTTNAPSKWTAQPRNTREEALLVAREGVLGYLEGLREPAAIAIRQGLEKHFGTVAPRERTSDAENWAPAPNKSGFQFGSDDVCTNPERVKIPTPPGVECELLVAQMADGSWTFGYVFATSGGEDLVKYDARLIVPGEETRADALETALVAALERTEPDGAVAKALQAWAMAQATTASAELEKLVDKPVKKGKERTVAIVEFVESGLSAAEIALKLGVSLRQIHNPLSKLGYEGPGPWNANGGTEPAKLAFDGRESGRRVDFPSREDALEDLEIQRGRAGFSDYETRIEKDGTSYVLVYERLSGRAPVGNQAMAAAESPAATSGGSLESQTTAVDNLPAENPPPSNLTAPVLPGMAHEVNEHGVFLKPEEVSVPMPKKAECTIRLALAASGLWAVGSELKLQTSGVSGGPVAKHAVHETRGAALVAGLSEAKEFFSAAGQDETKSEEQRKIANRAGEAVVKFWNALPVDESATAPAAVRVAPAYRTEFAELPVAKIQENPTNNRKHYNPIKDRELADSLLTEGLHQPIAVRKLLDGEAPEGELPMGDASAPEYELIFGHRRRRAAIIAGIATLQAKIYYGLARKQATAIALIENLQRENINAMEEAEGYAQLMVDEGLTQEQCADRVGRGRTTVTAAVGLLRLPEFPRDCIRNGRLNSEHGKALRRFVPDTKARDLVPKWEMIVNVMAEQAIIQKVPSGFLERGVPFIRELTSAGLAVRIDQFGEHRLGAKQREHPAYFQAGDGDWVCFAPEHWQAEVAERVRKAAERKEADRLAREAEMAKLAKGGRKQLKLADLNPADYREFSAVNAPLLVLVPDDKKAAAKGSVGRTTVVTDVQLADRLQKAMMKEIKRNRTEVVATIEQKVRKKIAGLKRVGPRELAWLVFLIADTTDRTVYLHLNEDAARVAGVKLPAAALDVNERAETYEQALELSRRRLAALAKADGAALVRTLIADRLPRALEEIVVNGPDSVGAQFVKWWLDTDTLWLLEETDAGREELVEAVKASAWYAKEIGRVPAVGDRVEWGDGRGVVITVKEYEKLNGKWEKEWVGACLPVRPDKPYDGNPPGFVHVIEISALRFVGAGEGDE